MKIENAAVFFFYFKTAKLPAITKCEHDINNKTYYQSNAFNASLSAKLLQGGTRGNDYLAG